MTKINPTARLFIYGDWVKAFDIDKTEPKFGGGSILTIADSEKPIRIPLSPDDFKARVNSLGDNDVLRIKQNYEVEVVSVLEVRLSLYKEDLVHEEEDLNRWVKEESKESKIFSRARIVFFGFLLSLSLLCVFVAISAPSLRFDDLTSNGWLVGGVVILFVAIVCSGLVLWLCYSDLKHAQFMLESSRRIVEHNEKECEKLKQQIEEEKKVAGENNEKA